MNKSKMKTQLYKHSFNVDNVSEPVVKISDILAIVDNVDLDNIDNDYIKVGDKVLVCGILETHIKRISNETYYFDDENGKEQYERIEAIIKL